MFTADFSPNFKLQWAALLQILAIDSRYDALTALKTAIRMAAGLEDFWFPGPRGVSCCILVVGGKTYRLGVRFGSSYGKDAARIESIIAADGSEPGNITPITLKI